jgi:hypothetical protein
MPEKPSASELREQGKAVLFLLEHHSDVYETLVGRKLQKHAVAVKNVLEKANEHGGARKQYIFRRELKRKLAKVADVQSFLKYTMGYMKCYSNNDALKIADFVKRFEHAKEKNNIDEMNKMAGRS